MPPFWHVVAFRCISSDVCRKYINTRSFSIVSQFYRSTNDWSKTCVNTIRRNFIRLKLHLYVTKIRQFFALFQSMLPFRLVRLHVVAHRVINIEIRVRNANIETRMSELVKYRDVSSRKWSRDHHLALSSIIETSNLFVRTRKMLIVNERKKKKKKKKKD